MKRLAVLGALALGLMLTTDIRADRKCRTHGQPPVAAHQPWYNLIIARDKCRGRDQARQQKFWHDYYSSLATYYGMVENMDWVSYYKHHGTPIGSVPGRCGGPSSVQMAPLYLSPSVPWGITQNLNALWSPPHVPWGYTPCCSPDVPCGTCP